MCRNCQQRTILDTFLASSHAMAGLWKIVCTVRRYKSTRADLVANASGVAFHCRLIDECAKIKRRNVHRFRVNQRKAISLISESLFYFSHIIDEPKHTLVPFRFFSRIDHRAACARKCVITTEFDIIYFAQFYSPTGRHNRLP